MVRVLQSHAVVDEHFHLRLVADEVGQEFGLLHHELGRQLTFFQVLERKPVLERPLVSLGFIQNGTVAIGHGVLLLM